MIFLSVWEGSWGGEGCTPALENPANENHTGCQKKLRSHFISPRTSHAGDNLFFLHAPAGGILRIL